MFIKRIYKTHKVQVFSGFYALAMSSLVSPRFSLGEIRAAMVKVGRRGWGSCKFGKLLNLSIHSVTILLNLIISELCLSGTQVSVKTCSLSALYLPAGLSGC